MGGSQGQQRLQVVKPGHQPDRGAQSKPAGNAGLWDLAGATKYSPDRFYCRSTDGQGHYERMRVKVPPSVEAMIMSVVAEYTEYDTPEALIRDAIVHRLVWLNEHGASTDPKLLQLELQMAEMERVEKLDKMQHGYVESLNTGIDTLVKQKDWEGLVQLLTNADETIETGGWPEGNRDILHKTSEYGWAALRTERRKRRVYED